MKTFLKRCVRGLLGHSVRLMDGNRAGRYLYREIVNTAMQRTQKVVHGSTRLQFAVPNALCRYRADSFSTKEPETLEWIDAMPNGAVLWDIGANVGLYSCYAAQARGVRVFSFEPSVFNLELLARNIHLNDLTQLVTIVPLPLSEALAFSRLNMSSTDWGGALSTFGQSYGHDGAPLAKVFEFPTIGLSMVDAVERLNIPPPDYIKMDVDGIEHLILKGGRPILRRVRSALIEINDRFSEQADEARRYLLEAELTLAAKRHAEIFDHSEGAPRYTFNQIWSRQ